MTSHSDSFYSLCVTKSELDLLSRRPESFSVDLSPWSSPGHTSMFSLCWIPRQRPDWWKVRSQRLPMVKDAARAANAAALMSTGK